MTPLLRVASFALAAAMACAPVRAEAQRLAADGYVYRVDLASWGQSGRPTGTVVRITRQKPKGGKDTLNLPGTDDARLERDPSLEIDPTSGRPVVIYSRDDGAGYGVYVSRLDQTWTPPRLIAKLDGDNLEPQIRFDHRYLHVSWRQENSGASTYWRASFSATDLELDFGPERVSTDDDFLRASESESLSSTVGAPADDQFFTATIIGRQPGEVSRACIWGVRDEPVPINYRQILALPDDIRSTSFSEARYLGGRFTYWVTTQDNKLYYTTLQDGPWNEFRLIELSPQTSTSDARLMLIELNQRLSAGGH